MILEFNNSNKKIICDHIIKNKVCVLPSDTLYGLSTNAFNKKAVKKIYKLKKRDKNKPLIILISKVEDLIKFGIQLEQKDINILNNIWPNKITFVIECPNKRFKYIYRNKQGIGFRMPDNKLLREIIEITGPITSTTVNISSEPPAKTIKEAQKIFGSKIKLYVENGLMESPPSTVIGIKENNIYVIREGAVDISNILFKDQKVS